MCGRTVPLAEENSMNDVQVMGGLTKHLHMCFRDVRGVLLIVLCQPPQRSHQLK